MKHLEELSTEMISGFIRERVVEDGVAAKTANRTREVLHRMFAFAIEHCRYICPDQRYRNPVEGVQRIREPASVITWLREEQIEQQLLVLKDDLTLQVSRGA